MQGDQPDMEIINLLSKVPRSIPDELFEKIVRTDLVMIERIISDGHASPPGFWYDQEHNEWVMVLQGSAGLSFDGTEDILVLKTGDCITIPAHRKHRVEWTDPEQKTIWLAVHYQ
jgi:cupin 2 domain-containing protein